MPDHTVVIVGAGPTGVTAALLLGAAGVDCLLLERWADVYSQPRAVHLDDEVHRILGRIGVADQFALLSRPSRGLRLLDPQHRVLAEFGRGTAAGRHGYPAANMFDQPRLETLLRQHLGTVPSVTFRTDVEVLTVEQCDDHATVEVEDRSSGQRVLVRSAYVLGCDGANSVVRRSIGGVMRDLGFEQRWLVIDADTDADLGTWPGVHQVCDTERAATYMQVSGRRHRWEFRMHEGEDADTLTTPDRLGALLAPWVDSLDSLDIVRSAEYTFRAQLADRWRDRRVFLLGDAAHLTPPFIGQGMGAGLRDAQNLSWKLAGVLAGRLPEPVLDSYQAERLPHVRLLIRTAMFIGRSMTQGGEVGNALRRVVAPALVRVPGLRQRLVDSRSPGLRRSALITGAGPLVGALCPNALLDGGRRLDDENPGGFVLVTSTRPTASLQAALMAHDVTVAQVTTSSALGHWLRRGLRRYALVRPDGTVMTAGRRLERLSLEPLRPTSGPRRTG